MDNAIEVAAACASVPSTRPDGTTVPFLCGLYYELFHFLKDALADVCRASAPHWFALDYKCAMMVYELFDVWSNTAAIHYVALFSEPVLLKHREIFDVLRSGAEGRPKENCFLKGCRRVYALREAHGTATEHAQSSEDHETQWYKILGEEMFREDLQPRQKNDSRYTVRYSNKGGYNDVCTTTQLDHEHVAEISWQ